MNNRQALNHNDPPLPVSPPSPTPLLARGLTALILAFILGIFIAIVLPAESARMAASMPQGASIDTGFGISPQLAMERRNSYSPDQRFAYIYARWTFDLVWPLVYGLALYSIGAWGRVSLGRRFQERGFWKIGGWNRLFTAIPVLAVGFDFIENTAATVLMASIPNQMLVPATILSFGNTGKWLLVSVALLIGMALPISRLFIAIFDSIRAWKAR